MRRGNGYILVEAVVAMAVFSLGMVSVQSALREASFTRALAKDRTDAHFLLEQLMGAVEIQPSIQPGTWEGAFPGHPRFSYTYTIRLIDVPKPPIPPNLPPEMREYAATLELPVGHVAVLAATVRWTRLQNEYEEVAETILPPDRLAIEQVEEVRFRQRQESLRNR